MAKNYLHPDQRDVLAALLSAGCRFLIVGGHAFSAYAFIRGTKDLDVWIDPEPAHALKVWRTLAEFGAPLRTHGVTPEDFQSLTNVYQMGVAPARIDVLSGLSALSFEEAWADRTEVELDGLRVPLISLAHLIRVKKAAARDQDLLDVKALRKVQQRQAGK